MTSVKASPKGEFLLPKEVLDAHGFADGAEVEVSGDHEQIVLRLVKRDSGKRGTKLTIEEFLAKIPRINEKVEITDELIREAIDAEAIRRWDEENSR